MKATYRTGDIKKNSWENMRKLLLVGTPITLPTSQELAMVMLKPPIRPPMWFGVDLAKQGSERTVVKAPQTIKRLFMTSGQLELLHKSEYEECPRRFMIFKPRNVGRTYMARTYHKLVVAPKLTGVQRAIVELWRIERKNYACRNNIALR